MYIFLQGPIANIPITKNLNEWRGDHGVLFSIIRTFKGLEADADLQLVNCGITAVEQYFYLFPGISKRHG